MPARARCGFAAYFVPGQLEDHWVAEHWNPDTEGWQKLDAQLDATGRDKIGFEICHENPRNRQDLWIGFFR